MTHDLQLPQCVKLGVGSIQNAFRRAECSYCMASCYVTWHPERSRGTFGQIICHPAQGKIPIGHRLDHEESRR